jgi:hypothetical protein
MVVHVDADGFGHDLRNARVYVRSERIGGRIQPRRSQQHRAACAGRSCQEFATRKTAKIILLRHADQSNPS